MIICSVCRNMTSEETCMQMGIDARQVEQVNRVLRLTLCPACQAKARDHLLQVCFGCKQITWLKSSARKVSEGRAAYVIKTTCGNCDQDGISEMLRFVAGP